jgi:hypothetical protein
MADLGHEHIFMVMLAYEGQFNFCVILFIIIIIINNSHFYIYRFIK